MTLNNKIPFREFHTLAILAQFENQKLPLDLFLRNYFRKHSAVGSKDRKFICESIYGMIRWRLLLDHIGAKTSWESRFHCYQQFAPERYIHDTSIPPHIRVSFPKDFFQILEESLGEEKAIAFCLTSNEPAPTTIRSNSLKIQRDELLRLWKGKYPIRPCSHSSQGIVFEQKINFFSLEEFKAGFFEVQDEASQLAADLVNALPGDHFLDFCAGSGGKSLAIAPKMQGKGQLYLHDIRPHALQEAKKRMKRAGIQNYQICPSHTKQLNALKGNMDWVLVDAPCTGSGTLRRNPDMKWKFEPEMIARITLEQREIFKSACTFLKPKGHIVYATCSVLPQENHQQVSRLLEECSLELVGQPFETFPIQGGMDGFFGMVFRKKS